ncbi:hypothetical protein PR048_002921 [Dryococelus australis]|uniref:Uncharacterized protein n=1 Tax=Dryococelus australis TaxID=614101 RepID=A0ABQ9ILM2_9NEOP|nr:hypothetical protein PR048_002921 [Dryococelus australis]
MQQSLADTFSTRTYVRTVVLCLKGDHFLIRYFVKGAAVAERLDCQLAPRRTVCCPRQGHSRIFTCEDRAGRCRWSKGFLRDLPFPLPFHSGAAPYSPQLLSSALKTSMLSATHISSYTYFVKKNYRFNKYEIAVTQAAGIKGWGETGDPREKPPTSSIVRHDSHSRKSGVDQQGIEPGSPWWEASSLTSQPPWPPRASSIVGPASSSCERDIIEYRPFTITSQFPEALLKIYFQDIPPPHSTVAERLACSSPTRRTGFNPRSGYSRICASGNRAGRCRWSADFRGVLPFPPPLNSGAATSWPRFTLIGSQDHDVKSRPNLSTPQATKASRGVASSSSVHVCAPLAATTEVDTARRNEVSPQDAAAFSCCGETKQWRQEQFFLCERCLHGRNHGRV